MFVALSSLYEAPAKAAPQASDNLPKDSSTNLSTANLSASTSPEVNTSITNLIDRQENAVSLQPSLSTDSSASNLEVDKLAETTDVSQVTSVSQLSDVRPTDWAFTALQSLVERYGCIAGYPDSTFRGGKSLARYEFAAGLNACLDKINEIISAGLADKVSKEDLATLQKLQEEFAAELATLRGRVDALDAKTAKLEAQQFSTTTKLSGLAFFNLTGATAGGNVLRETGARNAGVPITATAVRPNVTFGYYLFLNLTTSFTGKDALVTQLVTGNGNSPANNFVSAGYTNSWGTPFLDQTGVPNANVFNIRELFYSFPVSSNVNVAIGPRLNFYRYFDGNRFTSFLTGATSFNSNGSTLSNAVDRGSGAVVTWTINPQFRFTAAYLGENTEFLTAPNNNTSSDPQQGLFGGTNTLSAELVYSPSRDANIRLLYTRSNIKANGGRISGATAEPLPYGFADDGVGGAINNATADTIILNFDWLVTKGFGVFGRYSYGSTNISPINAVQGGSVNVNAFQFGLAFPDLFKESALAVLSFVVPHSYSSGRNFLLSGGGDGATQYDLELSYYYPISKNIAIVPAFYAIFNPNSFSTNPTVFVGNLRTQFSF
ncbi:MAG: iron uptake porin [Pseudanabaena sp. M135S2SP2A07QC]|nr:iron uptake porin [Pseudanabaena sp. M090S1SP2A07QC]MCA6505271.1 iron uptake porin [Pseudanabaena sp. M172S2SP2A07QC]MCA6518033.1 iron uptake porin [Pseudanabaena sp. M110S1SP2A07QC]MCA6520888.1 iron uptake porin [Pseudanabaena sp. M051S1SP2A07QC]MCA6529225.1 iron uptake porin [Pseudanabaena sp. M125S2SP2A07QC]MCA6532859.1 iron uptake porin [Pseudanabaena sp. M176S2SP2A07QC]MCA6538221.1 iron uptake porin [Pseudanabaena sp. M037S2SP2A07QC]MCA6543047.1 iron uptake porin [Pseudanabaena sp. M